ncbi:flagellar assembly peptidoglycan hydrolase FlgJ [Mangrovimicrobium sediminis]|uniref:Peptidoglycan hydrolase FlgJ n=1 Tax=Mangrovimicrobium sediminis TaxID=2562682 RepID=A0A4Z0M0X7_9GAMM|nr:flagellar assembly peptidoglycan hydrolase FlgJ [Haliea sp. SAOS-164]TGD73140.1 flagellar assembly peptidoglycan hydrolase FlgJ [Haliea sp. SAOS-164]
MQSLTSGFALDVARVSQLSNGASLERDNPSLREAARQFEAMFLQQMLTSMRDAYLKSDLMHSPQMDFYESLMDQQWAQHMAGQGGIGLADQMVRQLTERVGAPTADQPAGRDLPGFRGEDIAPALRRHRPRLAPETIAAVTAPAGPAVVAPGANEFVAGIMGQARAVEARSGVPAELMVAQAVLETGWGNHRITRADGSDSYNLFGIKAGADWRGDTVDVVTHEYIGERRVQVEASFRAYASYEEAFDDYAQLITGSPRYAGVVAAQSPREAVAALLDAGYATDPAYGSKLLALLDQGLQPRGGS